MNFPAKQHAIQKKDHFTAAILFAVTFISRLLFQSQILYHWDSVNFAYSIQKFDLAAEQPHPPGYILYVGLIRLVNLVFQDPQKTMVAVSIVASALSVVALFYLGRAMFNFTTGLIAGVFLATSPLFWFYGEIALPHTLDALMVIVSAWLLYEVMTGRQKYLIPAVIVLSIAGGFRPQTLVFMLPLVLFAIRKVRIQRILVAGVVGAAVCLMWFIPLMQLSGGIQSYLRIMGAFSDRFQSTTSVLDGGGLFGLRRNLIKLSIYTGYGLSLTVVPALIALSYRLFNIKTHKDWEKILFFAIWLLPVLVFYIFIHMGQQGLVFVFLPALMLICAWSLVEISQWVRQERAVLISSFVLIAALNGAIFLFAPEYPLGNLSQRILTRQTLIHSDEYFQTRLQAVRNNFPPGNSAILAASWHHLQYYLPDYRIIPFTVGAKWEVNEDQPTTIYKNKVVKTAAEMGVSASPNGFSYVVIFDDGLDEFSQSPGTLQSLKIPDGQMKYYTLMPRDALVLDASSFGLLKP